jgi:hypothetical protein
LTTGEKDQFLNQMARYSAELLFSPKEQSVGGFTCPPGLDLIRKTGGNNKVENSVEQQGSMKMIERPIGGVTNMKRILGPGFGQIHGVYVSDFV